MGLQIQFFQAEADRISGFPRLPGSFGWVEARGVGRQGPRRARGGAGTPWRWLSGDGALPLPPWECTVPLAEPDGGTPDGIPYYDVSRLAFTGSDAELASADRVDGIELRFLNPNRVQFSYNLVVLGMLNRVPAITSTPLEVVSLGNLQANGYEYQVVATDPDLDTLRYTLLEAPEGMTISTQDLISWAPSTAQAGNYQIAVVVTDAKGDSSAPQSYTLQVTNVPNRPPQFTSTPVVEAYADQAYQYPARVTGIFGQRTTQAICRS